MIDVELTISGRYFTPILTYYKITEEIKYKQKVETQDGVEHYFGRTCRDVLTLKLASHTDFSQEDYMALKAEPLIVKYDKGGEILEKKFNLDCDLESRFLLLSCDGQRRYMGGEIRLRAVEVTR